MSELIGTDAMSGVIKIITKGFSNEFTGNINSYYTLAKHKDIGNDYSTGIYLSGALIPDVLGFSLYGRYFHKFEDKYDYENPKNSEQNYGAKLIYNVTDDDALILDLKRAKGINTRTVGRTSYLGYKSHENDENTQISLSHSGRCNDKSALHLHHARPRKIRLRPRAKRHKAAFQRF